VRVAADAGVRGTVVGYIEGLDSPRIIAQLTLDPEEMKP
jgi:hypothetical protein